MTQTDATRPVAVTADRLSIAIPGDWTVLPLDPKTRDRRIAKLVERRLGKVDQLANIRRQTIVKLRRYAAEAARRGAFFAALHGRLADGLPMSATAMASLLPPSRDSEGALLPDAEAMAATLARGSERSEVLEHSVVDLQLGQAARVRRRTATDQPSRDGGTIYGAAVDYFVPLPAADKTLALVFATPVLPLADAYTQLFDMMAATATWVDAGEPRR